MDEPLGQSDTIHIRKKIPYTTATNTGLQISGTQKKTPEGHPSQDIVPHLQETEFPPEHSHWTTNHGRLSLEFNNASTPQPPEWRISEHPSCGRGASGSTVNDMR